MWISSPGHGQPLGGKVAGRTPLAPRPPAYHHNRRGFVRAGTDGASQKRAAAEPDRTEQRPGKPGLIWRQRIVQAPRRLAAFLPLRV
jgi:hypothetical protein